MYPRKFTYGSVFSAVEYTNYNGKETLQLLQLEKKKKELVVKNNQSLLSIDEIKKDDAKHLFLVINNSQVITKKVDFLNEDPLILVQEAFPNIALQDFYFDTYSNDEDSFIAIARKTYIDTLIDEYEKKGIAVVGVGLGSLVIKNLLNFIKPDTSINTSNSIVSIDDAKIIDIRKTNLDKSYFSINGLEISNLDTLSLGGILSYYTGSFLGLEDLNGTLASNYEKKREFTINLTLILGFLLLSLLINFFVFNNYYSKVTALESELSINEVYKNQLISLQEEVKTKETVLESIQSVSQSKLAIYLDEVGQLVPNTISLSEINYQPITSRFKKGKQIKVDLNRILIKGVVKKESDFTVFVDLLESKNWIDNVIINSFSKNRNATNSFELLIDQQND